MNHPTFSAENDSNSCSVSMINIFEGEAKSDHLLKETSTESGGICPNFTEFDFVMEDNFNIVTKIDNVFGPDRKEWTNTVTGLKEIFEVQTEASVNQRKKLSQNKNSKDNKSKTALI